jgi:superfamily II DNA/RNA helicase
MPGPIKKLADKFLTNPKTIEVSRPAQSNLLIDQRVIRVDGRRKREALERLLRREEVTTAIVFSNRKTTVRELTTALKRDGFRAGPIHGDMEQPERIRELERFKAGEINILVASDVAARGLDIKGVSHVFNFDVPWQPDDYVHRIGRTGRAGKTGVSITLASSADAEAIDRIEKLIGAKIPLLDALPDAAPEAAGEPEPEAKAEKPARRERAPRAPRRAEKPREEKRREDRPAAETPRAEQPAVERSSREERPAAETPRAEQPAVERSSREERPAAEAPRADKPRREPRREPVREPVREPEDEAGWNGPVPSFLGHGFGG